MANNTFINFKIRPQDAADFDDWIENHSTDDQGLIEANIDDVHPADFREDLVEGTPVVGYYGSHLGDYGAHAFAYDGKEFETFPCSDTGDLSSCYNPLGDRENAARTLREIFAFESFCEKVLSMMVESRREAPAILPSPEDTEEPLKVGDVCEWTKSHTKSKAKEIVTIASIMGHFATITPGRVAWAVCKRNKQARLDDLALLEKSD